MTELPSLQYDDLVIINEVIDGLTNLAFSGDFYFSSAEVLVANSAGYIIGKVLLEDDAYVFQPINYGKEDA